MRAIYGRVSDNYNLYILLALCSDDDDLHFMRKMKLLFNKLDLFMFVHS